MADIVVDMYMKMLYVEYLKAGSTEQNTLSDCPCSIHLTHIRSNQ